MRTVTTADAILVVSASRFGYPGVLAEMIGASTTPQQAAELAAALGEIAAAVEGVTIALAGGLPDHPARGRATAPGQGQLDTMAELVVRCAGQADLAGVEVICADAAASGTLVALLCSLVRDINAALDGLDHLPGPGGSGLLERLGLAAAARV